MTDEDLRASILEIVRRERYPRLRTLRAQIPEDFHDMRIGRTLSALVDEGHLTAGGNLRDRYWCLPEDARS